MNFVGKIDSFALRTKVLTASFDCSPHEFPRSALLSVRVNIERGEE